MFVTSCAHKSVGPVKSDLPVQTGYASVNGLKMYYEVHGQGAPLVLIHGGGSTIESNYSKMIPLFVAQNRQVIAIEEQGHGHLPKAFGRVSRAQRLI